MRPLFILLFAAFGCDYFPEELLDASAGDAGGVDAGALVLAETCAGDVPMITTNLEDVPIDLTGLRDDISDIGFCSGADAPGNDGFFGVAMEAGEKWHFHLSTASSSGLNPAIYILDSSCDSRRCMAGDAIDLCGAGRDEHLSFVAPRAGTYFVGIDSRLTGGATYQLVALRPTCGNLEIEHSETCDDGNTDDGDGCDSLCRVELSDGMAELEPNDDPTGANHLIGGVGAVSGVLGGQCDQDLFVVELEEGASLNVAMRGPGGLACGSTTPLFELALLAANGTTRIAEGTFADGEFCPVLDTSGLREGTYYVSATTSESERPFNYTLEFTQP